MMARKLNKHLLTFKFAIISRYIISWSRYFRLWKWLHQKEKGNQTEKAKHKCAFFIFHTLFIGPFILSATQCEMNVSLGLKDG